MMGLTEIEQSKDLFRSLGIELTEERYKIAKLNFMLRIKRNPIAEKRDEELNELNVRNNLHYQINKLLEPLNASKYYNGTSFTVEEKTKVLRSSLKSFDMEEALTPYS